MGFIRHYELPSVVEFELCFSPHWEPKEPKIVPFSAAPGVRSEGLSKPRRTNFPSSHSRPYSLGFLFLFTQGLSSLSLLLSNSPRKFQKSLQGRVGPVSTLSYTPSSQNLGASYPKSILHQPKTIPSAAHPRSSVQFAESHLQHYLHRSFSIVSTSCLSFFSLSSISILSMI